MDRRPDGIIIEGLKFEDRFKEPADKSSITFHILEFTCTSEAYIDEATANKHKQHEEIVAHLRSNGWNVKLHVIVMGVRGWMPTATWDSLETLDVKGKRRQNLYLHLSRTIIRRSVEIVWLRPHLEKAARCPGKYYIGKTGITSGRAVYHTACKIRRAIGKEAKLMTSQQRKKRKKHSEDV
jgi:hypothetical protein